MIERLGRLNRGCEGRYERLRYVTFVKTRRKEMESAAGVVENAQGPEWKEQEGEVREVEMGGVAWLKELDRAVGLNFKRRGTRGCPPPCPTLSQAIPGLHHRP